MHKSAVIAPLLFLTLGFAPQAQATPIVYSAILSGANEVGPNTSSATGTATFTLNGNSLLVQVTFANLSAPVSAGHIHCCAGPGVSAAVVVPFSGLPPAISGSFLNTLDLSSISTYTIAFVASNGGTAAGAEAALIAAFNNGTTYTNLHDATYPGGEIRGQIGLAPSTTPEPSSLLLLGTGLLGIVQTMRRRMRSSS